MTNKTLGVIALLGAPSMALGIWLEQQYATLADTWWGGAWGIVYITTWMGSIVALNRLSAAGTSRFGRMLPLVMLGTMSVANLSNLWLLVAPSYKPTLYWVLDMCWPLSHVLMLVYGIPVAWAGRLRGWKRYAPLLCGLWLPVALSAKLLLPLGWNLAVGNVYNAVAWALLALAVLESQSQEPVAATPTYS